MKRYLTQQCVKGGDAGSYCVLNGPLSKCRSSLLKSIIRKLEYGRLRTSRTIPHTSIENQP
jgi:hypothetical protein